MFVEIMLVSLREVRTIHLISVFLFWFTDSLFCPLRDYFVFFVLFISRISI